MIDNFEAYGAKSLSFLGAIGVAFQNYQATVIFIKDCFANISLLNTQLISLAAAGICSAWVNLSMNIVLLEDFYKRIKGKGKPIILKSNWEKIKYYGGITIFSVTGILFGLMAFVFSMGSSYFILSTIAGVLVALIMTIQELETWLSSYEQTQATEKKDSQNQFGYYLGWIIAVGNVLALSMLFTLALAQCLLLLNCSLALSLGIGASIAFTFGAFTEYFFYKDYLTDFCQNIQKHLSHNTNSCNNLFGLLTAMVNGLVNAALAYAGIDLLFQMIYSSGLSWIPTIAPVVTIVLSLFAGTASLILGFNFWSKQNQTSASCLPELGLKPSI